MIDFTEIPHGTVISCEVTDRGLARFGPTHHGRCDRGALFANPSIFEVRTIWQGAWVPCSSCYTYPLVDLNSNDRRKHGGCKLSE